MLRKTIVTFGMALVFAAGYLVVQDLGGVARRRAAAGTPAPPFDAAGLAGGTLGPQGYPGQVVLVNFWATYCIPCVEEMPSLEKVWKDYQARGLVVLAVSLDDDLAPVRQFQDRFRLSFPMAHDPGKRIAKTWGTEKVPETYVISRSGEIRTRVMGAVDWNTPTYRGMLEGMLKEGA